MSTTPIFNFLPNTKALDYYEIRSKSSDRIQGCIAVLLIFCIIFYALSDNGIVRLLIFVASVLLSLSCLLYYLYLSKLEQYSFNDLAKDNNWRINTTQTTDDMQSLFFSTGHSHKIRLAASGEYHGMPMELFDFQYTIGRDRYKTDYSARVFNLKLNRNLPNLYIDGLREKSLPTTAATEHVPKSFTGAQKIKLEGDFGTHYDVYVPENYEISALTILSPDVMQSIIDAPAMFDIEIFQNNIYFYFPITAVSAEAYNTMFLSINAVMKEIYKSLNITNVYKSELHQQMHKTTVNSVLLKRRPASVISISALIVGIIYLVMISVVVSV